ncbi:toll/interleukin-1 receptor domain-containing protein [Lacibacter sp. H375]|uniref:toll/interleukin-1 receptor domain-containing protein n=1 Tax=Lacibacter sp. H375 TaxID=3133424 RepID=UPI0030C64F24
MGQSVLVFISHSSEDKEALVEPIVTDLESCYINVWLDKSKILPGDNLRKSIFRDGLDKADVVLIFFTRNSLKSSWVDREIKHVLRDETKKGNNFDLNKIISIFDCQETYNEIAERYPELTDDLLHLMPVNYSKIQLGQLISAIWSKYLSLQGGDVATQRLLLEKDKEIFQKDKENQELKNQIEQDGHSSEYANKTAEFKAILDSGVLKQFIGDKNKILSGGLIFPNEIKGTAEAMALGLIKDNPSDDRCISISEKGKEFFKWYLFENAKKATE